MTTARDITAAPDWFRNWWHMDVGLGRTASESYASMLSHLKSAPDSARQELVESLRDFCICPQCHGERRVRGHLCPRCNGDAQIRRTSLRKGEKAPFEVAPIHARQELTALLNPWRSTLERIKNRIDYRLNDCLCEMKPNYDDSIIGFNEAWDIVRATFKEELEKLPAPPSEDKT